MIEVFQKYMGSGLMLVWFLLALVYLYLHEERRHMRILFLYTPAIMLLLFFNPLFYRLFVAAVGPEIYFRNCWLLPVTPTVAYTLTLLWDRFQGKKRAAFTAATLAILMVSGNPVYNTPLYTRAENIYHVPQAVADICDAIEVEGREVMAAFPEEFLLYVRQYSPVVCIPYGREVIMGRYSELCSLISSDAIDAEQLAVLSKEDACHYVILKEGKKLTGDLTDYEYELFGSMHGYEIYRDTSMDFGL